MNPCARSSASALSPSLHRSPQIGNQAPFPPEKRNPADCVPGGAELFLCRKLEMTGNRGQADCRFFIRRQLI